jgi:hypothetical protein
MIQSQLFAKPILISRGFGAVVLSYHQSMLSASLFLILLAEPRNGLRPTVVQEFVQE